MLLLLILLFSILGNVGTIALAGLFLLFPQKRRLSALPLFVSYATGALLAAAFLGLIPEAQERLPSSTVMATILLGIILFFVLEKLVLWRHCHTQHCDVHGQGGLLILIGDGFHNFVDGVIIASAFLTSIPLGISTAVAVIVHEIPQEVSDFAILLQSGYSRAQVILFNLISGLAAVAGALLAYWFLMELEWALPYVMSLAAASFVYIATADLVPNLHRYTDLKQSVGQLVLMLGGIATIALIRATH